MANLNEERKFIDAIFKNNKVVIKEDIGRVSNEEVVGNLPGQVPKGKKIHVTIDVPLDKLQNVVTALEKANGGKINDMPLFATDLVYQLVNKYLDPNYIDPEDFIDMMVHGSEIEPDGTRSN